MRTKLHLNETFANESFDKECKTENNIECQTRAQHGLVILHYLHGWKLCVSLLISIVHYKLE